MTFPVCGLLTGCFHALFLGEQLQPESSMDTPIFHMASFSRSGETLVLRCLSAHPQIEVVHQILEPDTAEDLKLFRALTKREERSIPQDDPLVAHRKLAPGNILLLKNAVWTHKYPRRGFTLVRNPFSVVTSAYRDIPARDQGKHQKKQQFRWAEGIDPLTFGLMGEDPTLTGFTVLYTRKMLQDRYDGLPFVRYEDFVQDPERFLRKIVAHLGLEWDDKVMRSHELYAEGETGHGGIKLWKPINKASTEKYQRLTEQQRAHIYGIAWDALRQYGYNWDGQALTLRDDVEGML
ncbi:sulfotransferase [Paracoccus sp. Z330]|uniref:Sulfotransferase n=1 Tax=Paracoccus onchidii TaxID=3017813 RepID=A0ABT4ZHB1_9RHOB|nr:sulfotransferase [Paracoccus onchidii]MDB6178095.1 sulfotransferase [Paracoccus onchidii]